MRQTSGIVINDDIFINSSNVVKMDKDQQEGTIEVKNNGETKREKVPIYGIKIYMTHNETPISFYVYTESERNAIFNKIIMEMYGNNYAIIKFTPYKELDAK